MVGDHFQLPPRVDGDTESTNPCRAQLEMSLQGRAQRMGIQEAFFSVQYRAVPEIADIYSEVVYRSRITSDRFRNPRAETLARAIAAYNTRKYRVAEPVIFFDVPSARQEKDGSTIYCLEYANLVLRILEDLLQDRSGSTTPCRIAILTPYTEQSNRCRSALSRMRKYVPGAAGAKDVSIETADKVQGMDYDGTCFPPSFRPGTQAAL